MLEVFYGGAGGCGSRYIRAVHQQVVETLYTNGVKLYNFSFFLRPRPSAFPSDLRFWAWRRKKRNWISTLLFVDGLCLL